MNPGSRSLVHLLVNGCDSLLSILRTITICYRQRRAFTVKVRPDRFLGLSTSRFLATTSRINRKCSIMTSNHEALLVDVPCLGLRICTGTESHETSSTSLYRSRLGARNWRLHARSNATTLPASNSSFSALCQGSLCWRLLPALTAAQPYGAMALGGWGSFHCGRLDVDYKSSPE